MTTRHALVLSLGLLAPSVGGASDILIIAFGESNSGGQVLNTAATRDELAARNLNIWNITTDVFEPLDVGDNNNLGHFGLDLTKHAWEIGLANIYDDGEFGANTVRYLQTGQGGSKISEWESGDAYWLKFVERTDSAMAAIPGQELVVWWTLGINDTLVPMAAATWKPRAEELIGRMKTQLPGVKIYLGELMSNSPPKIAYNVVLAEIAASDSAVVLVSSAGLTTQDIHHWDYTSQKTWASRFARAMGPPQIRRSRTSP